MSSSDRDESSGSTLADAVVAALAKHENVATDNVLPGDEVTAIEARQVIVTDTPAAEIKVAEAADTKVTEAKVAEALAAHDEAKA